MKEDFDKKLEEMSSKYGLKEQEKPIEKNPAEGYVLGISLVSHTLVGMFMGYWVDKFFDCSPFGLLILLFLGFFAGFRHIWLSVK